MRRSCGLWMAADSGHNARLWAETEAKPDDGANLFGMEQAVRGSGRSE